MSAAARALPALLALMFLLPGCRAMRERAFEADVARSRDRALRTLDVQACERNGGHVRPVGMFGTPACVLPFADGGKYCRDKSDCQGACVAPERAPLGEPASGACQVDTAALYGCYNAVAQGLVVAEMCMD